VEIDAWREEGRKMRRCAAGKSGRKRKGRRAAASCERLDARSTEKEREKEKTSDAEADARGAGARDESEAE